WKPKRTIILGSWDAEEEGLVGSTEWAEQHEGELAHAVAYFNMDVGVAGPKFGASSVPSLKQFVRDVTRAVPAAKSGVSVYEAWQKSSRGSDESKDASDTFRPPNARSSDVSVGDLGSGSDYTAFLQHLGVPSTDIGSTGDYGVYHSVFDNFAWFKKFADPDFAYEQQMARIYGLEAIRMADADVLPYDYETYGKEIVTYIQAAAKKADSALGPQKPSFDAALDAAHRFQRAGGKIFSHQRKLSDPERLNQVLREAEAALLVPSGLPNRPWFRHVIYAPGRYTGYAAVVIPGVNEALDKHDAALTAQQLETLASALDRAARTLASFH
ncbi:MAG TPA: transferrin receptor-like dimerization domain-containing protein, partial [Terriglobales bacterium]